MEDIKTKTFDPKAAHIAQDRFCLEHKYPHFAPTQRCYDCGANIYQEIPHEGGKYKWTTGISVERAGSSLITKCPHCSHSYCD